MVQVLVVAIILIVVIAVYKRQIDDLVGRSIVAKVMKYLFIALLAAFVAFLAYMGIGEMNSGDTSGAMHLVTMLPFVVLICLLVIKPRKPTTKRRG